MKYIPNEEVGRRLSEPIKMKKLCIGLFIEYRFFSAFHYVHYIILYYIVLWSQTSKDIKYSCI